MCNSVTLLRGMLQVTHCNTSRLFQGVGRQHGALFFVCEPIDVRAYFLVVRQSGLIELAECSILTRVVSHILIALDSRIYVLCSPLFRHGCYQLSPTLSGQIKQAEMAVAGATATAIYQNRMQRDLGRLCFMTNGWSQPRLLLTLLAWQA